MKRLTLLITVTLMLLASNNAFAGAVFDSFSLGGDVGTTWYNGQQYERFSLQPDMQLGKLGLGLDLSLLWNDNGIKTDKLRLPQALRFASWGKEGEDPVYIRGGNLDEVTLGQGSVVNRYNNRSRKDVQEYTNRFGTQLGIDVKNGGLQTVVNDLFSPSMTATRVYVRPFQMADADFAFIKDIALGATYATDKLKGFDVGERIYSFDAELPILNQGLKLFANATRIQGHGKGIAAGVSGNVEMPSLLGHMDYILELQNTDPDYIPGYFDWTYETNRITNNGINWSDPKYALANPKLKGWKGEGRLSMLRNMVGVGLTYSNFPDYTGKAHPTAVGRLDLTKDFFQTVFDRSMTASLSVSQKDYSRIWDLKNPSSEVVGALSWEARTGVWITYTLRENYAYDSTGNLKLMRDSGIQTKIAF